MRIGEFVKIRNKDTYKKLLKLINRDTHKRKINKTKHKKSKNIKL